MPTLSKIGWSVVIEREVVKQGGKRNVKGIPKVTETNVSNSRSKTCFYSSLFPKTKMPSWKFKSQRLEYDFLNLFNIRIPNIRLHRILNINSRPQTDH
jgi:hypothetical protein